VIFWDYEKAEFTMDEEQMEQLKKNHIKSEENWN